VTLAPHLEAQERIGCFEAVAVELRAGVGGRDRQTRGLGPVYPHMLRSAFIMAALDAGVPLRDVQIAARHADPRTAEPGVSVTCAAARAPRSTLVLGSVHECGDLVAHLGDDVREPDQVDVAVELDETAVGDEPAAVPRGLDGNVSVSEGV
jgi:hypothetical protein